MVYILSSDPGTILKKRYFPTLPLRKFSYTVCDLLGMKVYSNNHSTWGVYAGGSGVQDQDGLHETMSQKTNKQNPIFTDLHYFSDNRNGHLCSEHFYSLISSFRRRDL